MANSLPSEVHAAFADASPAVGNRFGQFMDHADAVPPTAEITICCFIGPNSTGWALAQGACRHLGSDISCGAPRCFRKHGSDCHASTADGGLDWPAWDRLLDFTCARHDGIALPHHRDPRAPHDEIEELTRRGRALPGQAQGDRRSGQLLDGCTCRSLVPCRALASMR